MKIAFVITTLSYGGAEQQLLLLCRGLKRNGHDIVVGYLKPGGELQKAFQIDNIPVRSFDMKSSFDFLVQSRIQDWLKEYSPDIVHTHLFKADFYAGRAALSLGIPLISTKHNLDQYLKQPLIAWLARDLAQRSRRIIAVSNAVRDYLIKVAGFRSEWIDVIRVGIEPILETSQHVPGSRIRFGVVARLAKQKGHQLLLNSFHKAKQQHPEMELLLFGDGPLRNDLEAEVRELHLQDSVRFMGTVLDPNNIYSQFDVCVLPSLWEGAPVVLLEAMARGIPLIATSVGGVPEMLSSDCGILVPPSDQDALTQALVRMNDDHEFRSMLSKAGPLRVRNFAFEKTLEMHLRIYGTI